MIFVKMILFYYYKIFVEQNYVCIYIRNVMDVVVFVIYKMLVIKIFNEQKIMQDFSRFYIIL